MKRVFMLAVLLLSVFALAGVATAQTAQVDWVHGTDFSRFHTFTWAKAGYPIQDPAPNLAMAGAVQEELEAKGVQYVGPEQRQFDLFVTYNAVVNPDPQEPSRQVLTLKLRIFDSRNNNIIWRAGGYFTLTGDWQQDRSNARALLAEMFRQYPPPE